MFKAFCTALLPSLYPALCEWSIGLHSRKVCWPTCIMTQPAQHNPSPDLIASCKQRIITALCNRRNPCTPPSPPLPHASRCTPALSARHDPTRWILIACHSRSGKATSNRFQLGLEAATRQFSSSHLRFPPIPWALAGLRVWRLAGRQRHAAWRAAAVQGGGQRGAHTQGAHGAPGEAGGAGKGAGRGFLSSGHHHHYCRQPFTVPCPAKGWG